MYVTEAEVYNALSYTVWKSGMNIRGEIRKSKGFEEFSYDWRNTGVVKFFREAFRDCSITPGIYTHLQNLERDGTVERRRRARIEYKLTENGWKKRDQYEKKEDLPGLLPDVV